MPLDIYPGERLLVTLHNLSGEDHPMHLHGHSFQVVGIQGRPVDGPIKDTLTLRIGKQEGGSFYAASNKLKNDVFLIGKGPGNIFENVKKDSDYLLTKK